MENIQQKEIDNEQAIRNQRETDNKILANVSQKMGWIPNPLKLMAERPGTVETFMAHRNQIFEGGPLNEKEQALIALSAAVTLKSAKCIPVHADRAREAGAKEGEIIQTMLIASLLSSTSPLHIAYAGVNEQ